MSPQQQREEEIFAAALELPTEQRAAFLAEACAGNPELIAHIEALIGALDRASPLLKQPPPSILPQSTNGVTAKPGDKIGRYKILEQIGEGGCGLVYVAEQEEPVRRRVALKIIKLGMDTKQVIARFEAERQALALMDHPNIAKIHDAGATETGRPFFVMELVRGIRITDYCEQHQLPPRERLELFIQVCRAIQHAHQKGIIHRDIKPSNILVTSDDGVPVPKVIDFGIAKAVEGKLTDQTVYTAFEQFIGTPAYMSPEQAQLTMQDIDTRSDIYSLGVLLYELLTGTPPFDPKELLAKGLDEMRRTIREVEPLKPSTRLTQELSRTNRQKGDQVKRRSQSVSHSTLNHQLSTDLDWIVMKCLEKDRSRRYETTNSLATDIARHLDNEPIVARPPSKVYEFQKAFQRNKLAFAAGAAVFAGLMVGLSIAVWALAREHAARKEAEASADRARAEAARNEAVNKFFVNSPNLGIRGQDTRVVTVMFDELSDRADRDLSKQPEVQGDILSFIATRAAALDDYPRAITNLQKAVDAYRRAYTGATPRLARALGLLGSFQSLNKQSSTGKSNALLGVTLARKCGNAETICACLISAAKSFKDSGKPDPESIPLLREARHLSQNMQSGYLSHVESLRLLAKALSADGEHDEARTIAQEALMLAPSDEDLQKFVEALDRERSSADGQPHAH